MSTLRLCYSNLRLCYCHCTAAAFVSVLTAFFSVLILCVTWSLCFFLHSFFFFVGRHPAGTARHHFNLVMSGLRVSVEHPFGNVIAKFPWLDLKRNQKILLSPVGRLYRIGVLFYNCLNTVHPSQTSEKFQCRSVDLETYLNN